MDETIRALTAGLPPYLASWAAELERGRWSGWVIDEQLILRFQTSESRELLKLSNGRELTDEEAGIGKNIFEALTLDAWQAAVVPEKFLALLPRQLGAWEFERRDDGVDPREYIPESMLPLLDSVDEVETYGVIGDDFDYAVPGLPPLPVEFLLFRIRARTGEFQGAVLVNQVGLPATLQTLLARGDQRMYERMAALTEPRRCQGAILFADLQGSVALSKMMPTSTYFSLMRDVATAMDTAIASHEGIVGKHAGDGVSGYFLLEEGSSPSTAVGRAIEAGRSIRDATREIVGKLDGSNGVRADRHGMNVGLHWGGSIYMGQLVPGGRLDVTALGDSVNEGARIQECARDGALLASKPLIEHLTDEDAAALGIDLNRLGYRALSELEGAPDKVKRDQVSIPVTMID